MSCCCRSVFFKPTDKFFEWLSGRYDMDQKFVDVGAGEGCLTKAMFDRGYKIFGIDLMITTEPYPIGPPIMEENAIEYEYPEDTVAIFARPSHGMSMTLSMQNALRQCREIIYIGLERNYENDIEPVDDWKSMKVEKSREVIGDDERIGEDGEDIWILRKLTLEETIEGYNHTSDCVTEEIPIGYGVGIEWETDGRRAITVPRTGLNADIRFDITSFEYSMGAVHYYAKFTLPGVGCKWVDNDEYCGLYCSDTPKVCNSKDFEVRIPAKKDIYSFSMYSESEDGKDLMTRKGEMTHQFETVEEAYDALVSELYRLFGDEWTFRNRYEKSFEEVHGIDPDWAGEIHDKYMTKYNRKKKHSMGGYESRH